VAAQLAASRAVLSSLDLVVMNHKNRDTSVGIVTGCRMDDWSSSPSGLFSTASRPAVGVHPPMDTDVSFPRD
jgi:hypothetical protein